MCESARAIVRMLLHLLRARTQPRILSMLYRIEALGILCGYGPLSSQFVIGSKFSSSPSCSIGPSCVALSVSRVQAT